MAAVSSMLAAASCGFGSPRELRGTAVPTPPDFRFVGDLTPCYLELPDGSDSLRVNCFHLDGILAIHTGRYAELPRVSGENWAVAVRRDPDVRVEIADKIYALRASPIDDEELRVQILRDRGYWHAWDGITIVRFLPRDLDPRGAPP